MLYSTFTVQGEEYKLRLGARQTVELEKKLGTNPLNVFMELGNGGLPKMEVMIAIIHAALQKYHHGMSIDKVYDLVDDFYDEGGSFTSLVPVVIEIFQVSGFLSEQEVQQAQEEVSPN